MDIINEKTTSYLTATFLDKDGNQVAPASMTYRIDCLTTGRSVRASTDVGTPAAAQLITLTSDDTAIIDATNDKEVKEVTVIGTYGASDEVTSRYRYVVQNLTGVT